MSDEPQKRARDSEPDREDPDQRDEQGSGTLAAPEPTSGVVERATGLPAQRSSDRRDTPKALVAWDLRDPSEPEPISWDQRDTPQFDLWADRTASVSLLSPEEADRHADRIRPAWEEPDWARQHGVVTGPETAQPRELRQSLTRTALWRALPADEADQYAARIRPSWQTPLGPPKGLFASDDAPGQRAELVLRIVDSSSGNAELPDATLKGELEPTQLRRGVRAQLLRGWLITGAAVGTFVAFLMLALSGPSVHTVEPAATERGALSMANAAASISMQRRAGEMPGAMPASSRGDERTGTKDAPPPPSSGLPAVPGSSEQAQPSTVRVRISAEPPRAHIRMDGVQVSNPFDSRNPSGVRHRVVVSAHGYQTRDFTLHGAYDERIRVTLVRSH